MEHPTRHIAVLTGDLVNSTALGPEKIARAFEALEDCARTQEEWMGAPLHFTRHRGDGWQVALEEPEYALRSVLIFRAALKSLGKEFDSSAGIAEGEISGRLGPNLNVESSPPFVTSGRALEIAKKSKHQINHSALGATEGMAILLDRISKEWTPAQAQAMQHALKPLSDPNFTEIGGILGKSRQSVSKSLEAAWYEEVSFALTMLENY